MGTCAHSWSTGTVVPPGAPHEADNQVTAVSKTLLGRRYCLMTLVDHVIHNLRDAQISRHHPGSCGHSWSTGTIVTPGAPHEIDKKAPPMST